MPIDPRRRDDIAAAVAAHNTTIQARRGLPPEAARLLAVMFPKDDVCRRTVGSFAAEGFDHASARRLLLALLIAGFVSKAHPGERGLTITYRLHLPPRQQ